MDPTKDDCLSRNLAVTKEIFGEDIEIYAVGFSMGSNLLMRYMGSPSKCEEKRSVKAIVSVSGAFDMAATVAQVSKPAFGLLDFYVLRKLKSDVSNHVFSNGFVEGAHKATSVYEYESMTRARELGVSSAAKLLRRFSCNAFVANIETPLLVVTAKDDLVTKYEFVPVEDLQRCPKALTAVYDKGGHCDFFFEKVSRKTGKTYHKEFMAGPTFTFFEQVD